MFTSILRINNECNFKEIASTGHPTSQNSRLTKIVFEGVERRGEVGRL